VLSGLILRFSAPQNVTTWFAPLVVTCLVKFKLRKSLGVIFQNPNVFANSAPVICVTHSLGHFEFNAQRSLASVRCTCQSSFAFISDDYFLSLISVVDLFDLKRTLRTIMEFLSFVVRPNPGRHAVGVLQSALNVFCTKSYGIRGAVKTFSKKGNPTPVWFTEHRGREPNRGASRQPLRPGPSLENLSEANMFA